MFKQLFSIQKQWKMFYPSSSETMPIENVGGKLNG